MVLAVNIAFFKLNDSQCHVYVERFLLRIYQYFFLLLRRRLSIQAIKGTFMRSMQSLMLWLLCLSLPVHCYAQDQPGRPCNEPLLEMASAFLKVERLSQGTAGGLVAHRCKKWPADANLFLYALVYDVGNENGKQFAVVLMHPAKDRIEASYKTFINEDSMLTLGADSIELDTAPYVLKRGVRAFGVDVKSEVSHACGDGGAGPVRILYIQQGRRIRPILKEFPVYRWHITKGEACSNEVDSVQEQVDFFLSVATTATHGYADINVTSRIKMSDGSTPKRKDFRYMLRFNGKEYPLDGMEAAYRLWRAELR